MRGVEGKVLRRVGCAVLGTTAIALSGCAVPQIKIVQPGANHNPTPTTTTIPATPPPVATTPATPTAPPVATTPTTPATSGTTQPGNQLPPTTGEAPASRSGNVTWHGGPVQRRPRIYTIFLTNGASPAVQASTIASVNNMVQSLRGSPWARQLTQYYDQQGAVTDDIELVGTSTDTQALTTNFDPTAIIDQAIAQNGWPVTPDSQFMLVLPPNILVPGAAGGHNYLTRYPGNSYAFSIIAGSGATVAPVTTAAAHEIAETITDPKENGWYVTGRQATGEVGDMCDTSVVDQPDSTGASNEISAIFDLRTAQCGPSGAQVKYQHPGE